MLSLEVVIFCYLHDFSVNINSNTYYNIPWGDIFLQETLSYLLIPFLRPLLHPNNSRAIRNRLKASHSSSQISSSRWKTEQNFQILSAFLVKLVQYKSVIRPRFTKTPNFTCLCSSFPGHMDQSRRNYALVFFFRENSRNFWVVHQSV